MQFVFDNADVNIATATGHGTFHAMCTLPLQQGMERSMRCQHCHCNRAWNVPCDVKIVTATGHGTFHAMSTLPLQQGMERSMRWVVIALTTPHFQADSFSFQHPEKIDLASVIKSYSKIPLKYYKKRATLQYSTSRLFLDLFST